MRTPHQCKQTLSAGAPTGRRTHASRPLWSVLFVCAGLIASFLLSPLGIVHAAGAGVTRDNQPICQLELPPDPLTPSGLATPFQLSSPNSDYPCHEASLPTAAFVQAALYDPEDHTISLYNPVVVDKGTRPFANPLLPSFHPDAIVALWISYRGPALRIQGAGQTLQAAQCVTGADNSPFGSFAYCNAPAFFRVASQAIRSQLGSATFPHLPDGNDDIACPTLEDFWVVNATPVDAVSVSYLVKNGQIAQDTEANRQAAPQAQVLASGGNTQVLAALNQALGCQHWRWTAPDLTDQTHPALSAFPLDLLQANLDNTGFPAYVPSQDPLVKVNARSSRDKLDAYRAGVDQPAIVNYTSWYYCLGLKQFGIPRLQQDQAILSQQPSPDPIIAPTLLEYLNARLTVTQREIGCA